MHKQLAIAEKHHEISKQNLLLLHQSQALIQERNK